MGIIMRIYLIVPLIMVFIVSQVAMANVNLKKEIELNGRWKFKTGDSPEYEKTNFDDSDWDQIWVPSKWEDQGYSNYDGMAWYRIDVDIPTNLNSYSLFLNLGKIDDADCVYFNGQMIGKLGELRHRDHTAYQQNRLYPINSSYIKWGKKNVIAVQVWDRWGDGGIYQGDIGIYSTRKIKMEINLEGSWKAKINNRIRFKETNYDDNAWNTVTLPSNFTSLGWLDYDGYAWFRKEVKISSKLKNKKLVLVLGKIDDSDRVYLNGTLIGTMGNMPESKGPHGDNSWDKNRVYYIPKHLIRWNDKNVISIQVYDRQQTGGFIGGPMGITTEDVYLDF